MLPLRLFLFKISALFVLQLGFSNAIHAQCVGSLTAIRFNNLDVSLDQENNQLLIFGLECDPCAYLYEEERTNCQCPKDCSRNYDACVQSCYDNFSNLTELGKCLDACIYDKVECKEECGPEAIPIRTSVSYSYRISFWWTTSLVETMDGTPNQVFTSTLIPSAPADPITLELIDDLSELEISYCYQTEVVVEYDDGICCFFLDLECLNRG